MIVILGGGLAGSLLAYRLSQLKPCPEFILIEAQDRLGGEHTWSFHESDLSPHSMNWIRSLVACSWDGQEVRFQDYRRLLLQPYHSVTSTRLDSVIRPQLKNHLLFNEPVLKVESNDVYLQNKKIEAQVVFDARGLEENSFKNCGFQKFVGLDLELEKAHGLNHPVIMDVNCEQKEGYRFFYVLPWNSHSLLVEDTRYSSTPEIQVEDFKDEIRAYCRRFNWSIRNETRVETGSLPIPLSPSNERLIDPDGVPIGMRGEYFHWTTGYSFSFAVRVAEAIAQEFQRNSVARQADFNRLLSPIRSEIKKQSQYFSLLNRMMFLAAKPSERWKIFHRFYHFNEDLIFRFYKGDLKFKDRARILIGRPPVPVYSALKSIFNGKCVF